MTLLRSFCLYFSLFSIAYISLMTLLDLFPADNENEARERTLRAFMLSAAIVIFYGLS